MLRFFTAPVYWLFRPRVKCWGRSTIDRANQFEQSPIVRDPLFVASEISGAVSFAVSTIQRC